MYEYLHIGRAAELPQKRDYILYRALEIMPGFLAWGTLLLVIILSFKTPVFIALFIIAFDVYWLIKTVYLSFHLRISYKKLRRNLKINWLDRLRELRITNYELQITNYDLIMVF